MPELSLKIYRPRSRLLLPNSFLFATLLAPAALACWPSGYVAACGRLTKCPARTGRDASVNWVFAQVCFASRRPHHCRLLHAALSVIWPFPSDARQICGVYVARDAARAWPPPCSRGNGWAAGLCWPPGDTPKCGWNFRGRVQMAIWPPPCQRAEGSGPPGLCAHMTR